MEIETKLDILWVMAKNVYPETRKMALDMVIRSIGKLTIEELFEAYEHQNKINIFKDR